MTRTEKYEKRCKGLPELKVGDKVLICRRTTKKEDEEEWSNSWTTLMTDNINEVHEVKGFNGPAGVAIDLGDLTQYFPRFVLKKVPSADYCYKETRDAITAYYEDRQPYTEQELETTTPTKKMKDLITKPTLSEGEDITKIDESSILNRICAYRGSIAHFSSIEVDSKHIKARIKKYEDAVAVLVKELDTREV